MFTANTKTYFLIPYDAHVLNSKGKATEEWQSAACEQKVEEGNGTSMNERKPVCD